MKMNRIKAIALAAVLCMTGCSSTQVEPFTSDGGAASPAVTEKETSSSTAGTPTAPSTESDSSSATSDGDAPASTSAETTASTSAETAASTGADTPAATTATTAATTTATTAFGPTDIGGRPAESASDSSTGGFLDSISEGFSDIFGSKATADEEISIDYSAACEDVAEGGFDDGFIGVPPVEIECPIEPIEPYEEIIQPEAGLLTGGEWNDNSHWSDWQALYSSRSDWSDFKAAWRIGYDERIAVRVVANGAPIEGAVVSCPDAAFSAVTDNKGMAYLFFAAINGQTAPVTAEFDGISAEADGVFASGSVEIDLGKVDITDREKLLDFMIMCDTTGSMSDELEYLKEELNDIIRRVQQDNANIPTRLSVNFYRDEGDEYIVREYPFTSDIDAACEAVSEQRAMGGGDFPEAVHTALDSALNDHDWDEDAVKILFLVLDAPPHEDAQIVDSVNSLVQQAAEMGVRIIPIASSGIDKSTEYLLRTMAFTTGGTYTFLTNDSGIGGGHIEATVGAYNVEKLNDMMVRIVDGYLS